MANPKLALIPSAYKAGTLYSPLPTNGDGDFTFTRNSVATRLDKDGLIEEVAINTPRLDYSDGGCPSLLLEPSRTNLITKSNDLSDNAVFVGFNQEPNAVSTQDEIGVDGQLSAWTFEKIAAAQNTYVSIPTNNEHTFSFYVKKQNNIGIRILENVGNNTVFINLETGLTFNGNLASTTTVQDFNSEWWRISVTHTATNSRYYIYLNDGVNLTSQTGTVVLQNFQLEQGSYATSYIPTNGSIATRVADLCAGSGDADVFNDDEGVLYVETGVRVDNGFIALSDGTTSNRVCLFLNETNKTIRAIVSGGGGSQMDTTYTSPTSISDNVKVALKYKLNDFSLFVNGVKVATDTSGITPITISRFDFAIGAILPFYGKCKEVKYYDKALTDAELTELTTL